LCDAYVAEAAPPPDNAQAVGAQASAWRDQLSKAAILARLPPLLSHPDPGVRAKACCLLGNLCRLSPEFYEPARESALLPLLARCSSDHDATVRKFAVFAAGNAAFHSQLLYPLLEPMIPALLSCLAESDLKTRANAAGALGNLVRNGGELVTALCDAGAPEHLVRLVHLAAKAPGVEHSGESSQHLVPARIALYSLGSLAAHKPAHASIRAAGLPHLLQAQEIQRDGPLASYAARLEGKLEALPSFAECGLGSAEKS
jgi:fused-like protein